MRSDPMPSCRIPQRPWQGKRDTMWPRWAPDRRFELALSLDGFTASFDQILDCLKQVSLWLVIWPTLVYKSRPLTTRRPFLIRRRFGVFSRVRLRAGPADRVHAAKAKALDVARQVTPRIAVAILGTTSSRTVGSVPFGRPYVAGDHPSLAGAMIAGQ